MYKSKLLYMIILNLSTEITIVYWQYKFITKLETSYFKLQNNTKLQHFDNNTLAIVDTIISAYNEHKAASFVYII